MKEWRGEPLEGKTILLYSEMGLGDEILLLRFAKPVKDLGARVIVSVRAPMFRLAHSLPFADAVIVQYGPVLYEFGEVPRFDPLPWAPDYICGLFAVPAFVPAGLTYTWSPGSPAPLPSGMGDLELLPCRSAYLRAEDWSPKLQLPPGFNIGICWASGTYHQEFSQKKSLALRQLAPLARPGVNLVSLQKEYDDAEEMRSLGIIDIMSGVTDFADTAWIVDQLDFVVTVDTSVAHLAGALGKPVWNLVRLDAVWPWLWETDATCWYRSMVLYRQSTAGDWEEPTNRMFADFNSVCVALRPPQQQRTHVHGHPTTPPQ
ncbi:hypothetical protein ABIF63_005780 [Bradyrhizobium japonicum]|uniref:Uncharacterized protein n=1 Tax=Bradyrhizobium japonicum TaxID=375 RepID=A0ABV2RZQ6_BRAJP